MKLPRINDGPIRIPEGSLKFDPVISPKDKQNSNYIKDSEEVSLTDDIKMLGDALG